MITHSIKFLAAAALALLLGAGAAQAADKQVRIDHPNGPATYVYRSAPETVAVYAGQGPALTVSREAEPTKRTIVLHQGRGQSRTITVPTR